MLRSRILKNGLIIVLAPVIVTLLIYSPTFFSIGNMISLLVQTSAIGILAIGMTFIIITGGIDLSVGSILYISGIAAVLTMKYTNSLLLAILAAGVVGTIMGMINALNIVKLNLPPLIATLAMMSVARGLGHIVVEGRSIFDLPSKYAMIGQGSIWFIPIPILIFAIIFFSSFILLNKKKFGRYLYAVGNNKDSAIASGIDINKVLMITYTLSGLFAGIGGLILTSRVGGSQFDLGTGLEFTAISAAVLGGTSMYGGEGSLWGTLVGIIIVGAIDNILRLLNVSVYYYEIVWGIVVFAAVFFDTMRKQGELKEKALTVLGQ